MPAPDAQTVARWARGLDGREAAACRSALEAHAALIRRAVEPALAHPIDGAGWLAGVEALAMQGAHDRYFALVERAWSAFADRPVLAAWAVMRRGRVAFLKGLYGQAADDAARAGARLAAYPAPAPTPVAHLDVWPPSAGEVLSEARLLQAALARNSGDPARALALARGEVDAADARADRPSRLRARFQVACALQALGRMADAEATYRGLFGELAALGAERLRALVLANLGLDAQQRGDRAAADAWRAEACAVLERGGDMLMRTKVDALGGAPDVARIRAVGDEESRLLAELARADALAAQGAVARAAVVLDQARWTADGLRLSWVADAAKARHDALSGAAPLVIDAAGFTLPSGDRVDLRRHRAPRHILLRLAAAHVADEGPLPATALIAAGWPGERMRPDSGLARVYTAVRTLRRLGLEGRLLTEDDGYRLIGPLRHPGA